MAIEYQVDNQTKNAESNGKEEPNEILHVVSDVGFIIFLVPVPNLFAFVSKHYIKESRIPSPIQISIIASVLRPNVPNTPILSVDQPQN